jgi:hypothetical protein
MGAKARVEQVVDLIKVAISDKPDLLPNLTDYQVQILGRKVLDAALLIDALYQSELVTARNRIGYLEGLPSVKKMLEFEKEIGAVLPDLLMRLHEAQMQQPKHPSEE